MAGKVGTSEKAAEARDDSALAVGFGKSGKSVSFNLPEGGLEGLFEPRGAGAVEVFENGDGAGMGPGNGATAAAPGNVDAELDAAPELGSVGGSESGSVGGFDCKPVADGYSGSELSIDFAPAVNPELDSSGRLLSDAVNVEAGGITAGIGIKEFVDSSFGAESIPLEREGESAPGKGRYCSGGGSARAPLRF